MGSVLACLLFALVVVFGSIWIAVQTDDPLWVNRFGALLTAFSGALVVYLAFFEEKVKAVLQDKQNQATDHDEFSQISPRAKLAERIRDRQWKTQETLFSARKLLLICVNSLIAISGEIIQGFGDLLLRAALAAAGHDGANLLDAPVMAGRMIANLVGSLF